jgi:hypothetical protein
MVYLVQLVTRLEWHLAFVLVVLDLSVLLMVYLVQLVTRLEWHLAFALVMLNRCLREAVVLMSVLVGGNIWRLRVRVGDTSLLVLL